MPSWVPFFFSGISLLSFIRISLLSESLSSRFFFRDFFTLSESLLSGFLYSLRKLIIGISLLSQKAYYRDFFTLSESLSSLEEFAVYMYRHVCTCMQTNLFLSTPGREEV